MTYSISKDFEFSASHQLFGLVEGHKCGRVHGHNYTVRITLEADRLDEHGFVLDYGDLAPFGRWLDEHFDHRHLNDVVDFQPSAENLARWLWIVARREVTIPFGVRVAVSVSETRKTWATWQSAPAAS